MNEKPIIFSTEMVKAILEGKKSQTRRVMKPQPDCYVLPKLCAIWWGNEFHWPTMNNTYPLQVFKNNYGMPGDRLWVKETWTMDPNDYVDDETERKNWVAYRADEPDNQPTHWGWNPSIFMPRWASRITLEITGVRVERVQDISEADEAAEGILTVLNNYPHQFFINTWDSLNSKRGYSWDSNPWVWVIEFKQVKP